ncbi:hypothetical protein GCM10022282_24690 [Agromyces indicus]
MSSHAEAPRYSGDMSPISPPRATRSTELAIAAIAVVTALVLTLAFADLTRRVIMPTWLQVSGAYLAVWVPLGAAVAVSARRNPVRWRRLLRITPLDVLLGIGVGLLARATATLIQAGLTGVMPAGGIRLELDPVTWWVGLLIAPVLLAPLVEELFFRGLTQPAVADTARAAGSRPRAAAATGVVVAAAVFALLHTLDAATPSGAWTVGLSTFVLGCAVGALVATTGRLGGAFVAHAVFNLTLVLLLM